MPRDGGPGESLIGIGLRAPPANVQAEQSLLGALLANNKAYERVCDFLRPEHFADPAHSFIYRALESRVVEGRLADAVTLAQDFENTGVLDDIGGSRYLAQLLSAMVGIVTAAEYGRAIHDTWVRRQLIEIGEVIVNGAFGADPSVDGSKQIEAAERALADLASNGRRRASRLLSFGDAMEALEKRVAEAMRSGTSPALATGLQTFDDATTGLWPAELVLIAGIPGSGKTAIAMQIAVLVAHRMLHQALAQGASDADVQRLPRVLLLSREMSPDQLAARVAAQQIGVSAQRLLKGDIDMHMAADLAQRGATNRLLPLDIQDCRATPLKLIGARARMLLQRRPTALVILDHLLIADPEQPQTKSRNSGFDAASVSAAAYAQKDIAAEFEVPYVVLTQMSRPARDGTTSVRRPALQSLKYGGEDAADTVMFVHRPIMMMDDTPPRRGDKEGEEAFAKRSERWRMDREAAADVAELVVAKRRMGATGVWRMRYHGPTTSFHELNEQSQQGGDTSWPE